MGAGGSSSIEGYRVIHLFPGSPLEEAALSPYTDFIVSANGIRLLGDSAFSTIISKSINCKVFLKVFDIMTKKLREAVVTPREEWGGNGLLGGTVRFEEWNNEDEFGVRVIGILPDSPAAHASLEPGFDYIIGTDELSISNIEQLAGQTLKRQQLDLDVFNAQTRLVRRVHVEMDETNPTLGLDLGQGFVHTWNKHKSIKAELNPQVLEEEKLPETPIEKPKEVTVTYLKPKEEKSEILPPPKAAVLKAEGSVIGAPLRVYRILGPPNIYEQNTEGVNAFIVNILQSPFVKAAEA